MSSTIFLFLDIEASQNADSLHLSQHKYIYDLLVHTNLQEAKMTQVPSLTY